jgi:hypothetical protein
MQFDYEIPVEEYVSAQVLHYKAYAKGRIVTALDSILIGLFFVAIAVFQRFVNWEPILLLLTGAWFVYRGFASLFLRRHYRRFYSESGMSGDSCCLRTADSSSLRN